MFLALGFSILSGAFGGELNLLDFARQVSHIESVVRGLEGDAELQKSEELRETYLRFADALTNGANLGQLPEVLAIWSPRLKCEALSCTAQILSEKIRELAEGEKNRFSSEFNAHARQVGIPAIYLRRLSRWTDFIDSEISLRAMNPEGARYLTLEYRNRARPKPPWIGLKTATRGRHAGKVVRPARHHFKTKEEHQRAASVFGAFVKVMKIVNQGSEYRLWFNSAGVLQMRQLRTNRVYFVITDIDVVIQTRDGDVLTLGNGLRSGPAEWERLHYLNLALDPDRIVCPSPPTSEAEFLRCSAMWLVNHGGALEYFDLKKLEEKISFRALTVTLKTDGTSNVRPLEELLSCHGALSPQAF